MSKARNTFGANAPAEIHRIAQGPQYSDVTTLRLKEMYPTDKWVGRFYQALKIQR